MYGVVEDLMKFDDNENNCIPHKHDLISSLAVGGRWITRQNDLQVTHVIRYFITIGTSRLFQVVI